MVVLKYDRVNKVEKMHLRIRDCLVTVLEQKESKCIYVFLNKTNVVANHWNYLTVQNMTISIIFLR